jgi:hypothetical protein
VKKKKEKDISQNLFRISLFIIFDALVFHEALSIFKVGTKSIRQCPSTDIITFFDNEWKKIIKSNYIPVFQLAHEVLTSFPTSPTTDAILKRLIDTALRVVSSGVLFKHDLMGRIYHKLLLRTMGQYYATYYTSIPAAWILANLTVKEPNPDLTWDFSSVATIEKLCILDPACGSGTLLSAVYSSVKDRYILEKKESLNLRMLHRELMEKVLNGWDILDYASHLTLTSLALHNYRAPFSKAKIYTLRVGVSLGKKIHLGSLDCLSLDQQLGLPGMGFTLTPTREGLAERTEEEIEIPKCDIVIMNPPFSRSAKPNVKFGYKEEKIKELLSKELRRLGEALGFKGIGQAGLAAYFILLGDKLLKNGARMAVVLPRAFLSGVAWAKIREKLLKGYELEYIISNHEPGDKTERVEPWNFSENTHLGEVLIVARKTLRPLENRTVSIVNIYNKPRNEIEALLLAHQSMERRKRKDLYFLNKGSYDSLKLEKEVGTIYNVSQKDLRPNFLCPCLFANPHLNKFTYTLFKKKELLKRFNPVPLGDVTDNLGIDIKQIKETFKQTKTPTPYRILWGHTSSMNTVEVDRAYVSYGHSIIDDKSADSLYKWSGKLLIAERPHLNNENLLSMVSTRKVLATAFWEVNVNESLAKILVIWLNSTFGFCIYLACAINSMGQIFKLKKAQLEQLPILNPAKLSTNQKKTFLNFYNLIRNEPFQNFPAEFSSAFQNKGVRKKIDDFLVRTLGLKIGLNPIYEMLSKEPIISLERL